MAVTIKDVAALAGVSPSTVSRTCKNNPSISTETKEKVRKAMIELGYEVNFQASNLASQYSRTIGIILPASAREVYENAFYLEAIRGISHYCNQRQYMSTVVTGQDEDEILKPQIGVVRGLAWTSVGGDTLSIEVNVMPGKGKMELTGCMGDVMKESAQIGLSYVRAIAENYGIDSGYFEKHDIHLHIPEGAVPKDGPSAGITMALAILSAITGIPVRGDIAMTGEITLRGKVLPIGGLKEKLLAAKTVGVKEVLVPARNKRNVVELDEEITDGMKITYVEDMNEVIEHAMKK